MLGLELWLLHSSFGMTSQLREVKRIMSPRTEKKTSGNYFFLSFRAFVGYLALAVNTLRAGLIQAVRKKQLIRTWLCARISPLLYALQTR